MTEWWKSLILGLVEGLTEFVPVSSTGHLILSQKVLRFSSDMNSVFTVVIQAGAMLAVVTLCRKTFASILLPRKAPDGYRFSPLLPRLALTTAPALIVGPVAFRIITQRLFSPRSVAFGLIAGAAWMLIQEKLSRSARRVDLEQITLSQALAIGLFQCLGMWPGISRSAATILGGMLCGLSRQSAARYSFLAAVPVILAASAYDLLQEYQSVSLAGLGHLTIGFVTAYLAALLALRGFLRWISHHTYIPFAYYRVLVGLLVLLLLAR